MINDFINILRKLFNGRWEEICNNSVNDEEYKDLADKKDSLYRKINNLLPDDAKPLIEEYNELETRTDVFFINKVYEQGLEDGFKLKTYLKV